MYEYISVHITKYTIFYTNNSLADFVILEKQSIVHLSTGQCSQNMFLW